MATIGSASLEFNPKLNTLSKGKELRDGLSAVLHRGRTLWVANDETIALERLTRLESTADGHHRFGEHKQFPLHDYLDLPVPPPTKASDIEEVDVEGMDVEDGYIWLVGSHSLKRVKPDKDESPKKNAKKLAEIRREGNRFLLARIPVVEQQDGTYTLEKQIKQEDGSKRTAARLAGDDTGNELTRELAKDKHLKPFLESRIPGKDNGFDIEGLAVCNGRVLIGLRGPVLLGHAIIIEIAVKTDGPGTLKLKKLGPGGERYRKHFLHLGGLGIRDLCVRGSDLLILAGPTLDLDGPVSLFCWPGGADPDKENLLPKRALKPLAQLPVGDGVDHPEGITLFSSNGGDPDSLLVVYDSPSEERQDKDGGVRADIIALNAAVA